MSTATAKTGKPIVRSISLVGIAAVLFVGWKVLSNPVTTAPAGGPPRPEAGAAAGQPKSGGLPVVAARVRRKDMLQILEVTGTLRTDEDVRVGSRIPGRVTRVAVKEGDRVRPGQLLVALDDGDLRAQLARAQGASRAAQAKLDQLVHSREYRVTQLRKDLERAQSGVAAGQAKVAQAKSAASITETETETQVESARANVNASRERLKIVTDGARKQELRQATLAVEQARAEMENARTIYERRARLFAQDAIAREDVDVAETHKKVAEATYQAALERKDLMVEGARTEEVRVAAEALRSAEQTLKEAESARRRRQISEEEVRTAEAQLAQAQSNLDSARASQDQDRVIDDEIRAADAAFAQSRADSAFYETQLRDTRIYSPVAGVVSTRSVNPGESVTPNSVLMNIVALNQIYVEAQVPELDLSQVRQGMTAGITIDSLPDRKFSGTVREIIPVADPAIKAFRVRIAVVARPGDPQLPTGSFARANVDVGRRTQTLVVPKSAIKSETGEKFLYVIEDGRAKRTPVQIGLTDDTDAEVLQGVKPGQQIVAAASPAISDNAPVAITK
jgi:RND family efflux transporter MFP subunit